jgi:hypothetical protein
MLLLQVTLLAFAVLLIATGVCSHSQNKCVEPHLNLTVLEETKNNGGCILLKRVCADDGMLVTFDQQFTADNLTRASPYAFLENQAGLWYVSASGKGVFSSRQRIGDCACRNFPGRGGSNSDALVGHQVRRPRGPPSRHPEFPIAIASRAFIQVCDNIFRLMKRSHAPPSGSSQSTRGPSFRNNRKQQVYKPVPCP